MNELNYEPILYIMMREDIPDMNPGKGMAQAAHAQAAFDSYAESCFYESFGAVLEEWRPVYAFGTTIVLIGDLNCFSEITKTITFSGEVMDETYPFRNYWNEVFVRPEITSIWAFPTTDEEFEFMKKYSLHP